MEKQGNSVEEEYLFNKWYWVNWIFECKKKKIASIYTL